MFLPSSLSSCVIDDRFLDELASCLSLFLTFPFRLTLLPCLCLCKTLESFLIAIPLVLFLLYGRSSSGETEFGIRVLEPSNSLTLRLCLDVCWFRATRLTV